MLQHDEATICHVENRNRINLVRYNPGIFSKVILFPFGRSCARKVNKL
jgi:hypothetical protein